MLKSKLQNASISIVSMKFLDNQLVVEALIQLANTRAPTQFTIPLVQQGTAHIKSYKDLLEKTVLEYLSNEGIREETSDPNSTRG